MSRGNGGQDIFLDDSQRRRFLSILARVKKRNAAKLYAYCLMPNHFHLLIRVAESPLSKTMQQLLSRYSKHFNTRQNRKGHVFQSRYKAILCHDDPYFLELLRYVHLNPVRKKLVSIASDWPWSGHGELSGERAEDLLDLEFPLSLFDPDRARAGEKYREFIRSDKETPPAGSRASEHLAGLAQKIAEAAGINLEMIRGGRKAPAAAKARKTLIQQAVGVGFRQAQLARFLNCSAPAISKAMRPLAKKVNFNV